MRIILTQDIPRLGNAGDVVTVKDGYARNYLIPKKMAIVANEKNLRELEHHKRIIQKKIEKEYNAAKSLAERLSALEIEISKKVGEEGKLFGSVTNREIAEKIKEAGIEEIDSKHIILEEPIKHTGVYEVDVKVYKEVKATVKVTVIAEEN